MTLFEFLDQERIVSGVFGAAAEGMNVRRRDLRLFAAGILFFFIAFVSYGTAMLILTGALAYFLVSLIIQGNTVKGEVEKALEEVRQRRTPAFFCTECGAHLRESEVVKNMHDEGDMFHASVACSGVVKPIVRREANDFEKKWFCTKCGEHLLPFGTSPHELVHLGCGGKFTERHDIAVKVRAIKPGGA